MDKEQIIDMLEDTNIKLVTYIDIRLSLYGKDIVKIGYFDNENKNHVMKKEFYNSLYKGEEKI